MSSLTFIYTTKVGEMVDEIVYRHYQTHEHLQMVLNANPGLAKRGPALPEGVEITLPPAPVAEKQYITLW
ncbi:MAG: tail protein X [Aeromonadaceae bacterium]